MTLSPTPDSMHARCLCHSCQGLLCWMQDIFGLFVWAFRQLQDLSSPIFKRSLQILVTVAQVTLRSAPSSCLTIARGTFIMGLVGQWADKYNGSSACQHGELQIPPP